MEYAVAGPLVSLQAILLLLASSAAFCLSGSFCLGLLGLGKALKRSEWMAFSWALGAASFCMAVYALGLGGWLTRPIASGLLALFIAVPCAAAAALKNRPLLEDFDCGGCPRPAYFAIAAAIGAALALSAVSALAPETGMDALAYHLYLPKEFIAYGRNLFLPLTRESLWPLLNEMYFQFALLLQGSASAQLFHWCFYGMTAALVYCLGRRFYDKGTACWAALVFVFTPVHFAQAGYSYVDLSLAFYVFAALYAFLLADAENDGRLVFLSGLMAGAAAGTKYLGLDACAVLFVFVLVRFRASPSKALSFLTGCAVFGAAWYLRSWWLAKNPFFPLYPRLFGGHGWDFDIAAGVGMGKGPVDFLRFPWNLVMHPASFGGQMFGCLYLLFLPPLLFAARGMRRPARWILVFGVVYCFLLFRQSQQARFYVSVAPLAALAAGWSLHRFYFARAFWLQRLTAACLGAVLLFYSAVFVYRIRNDWKPVFGAQSAAEYLRENERSYKGWEWIRQNVRPEHRVLNAAEVRCFYAPRGLSVQHLVEQDVLLRKMGVRVQGLLQWNNYDFIWVTDDTPKPVLDYVAKNGYEPVYEYTFSEKPAVFVNRIYRRAAAKPGPA